MKKTTFENLPQTVACILVRIFTSSYAGAYKHHTLHPIQNIETHQHYQSDLLKDDLIKALANFRRSKEEELSFAAKAVRQEFCNPPRYFGCGRWTYTVCIGYLVCRGSSRRLLMALCGRVSLGR